VAVSLKSVAFPSPVERIAEPGVVYFGVILRRRPERSDPPEGPFLDTRVFSLAWPRKGWAPVPDAPTEIIEAIDVGSGDVLVMARQPFTKCTTDGAANEGFVPHDWDRDGQSPAARHDNVDDDDDV
jgi:hypothetical protein